MRGHSALQDLEQDFLVSVTSELNALLDLSWGAATKTLCSLVTEFLLQVLGESTWWMAVWVIRGDEGMGDIPGIRGVQGVCRFCTMRLNWHKNSDLGSEVGTVTGLNSATRCLIESMALLTKSIGIVTPLVLSIIVVVALRLISYIGTTPDSPKIVSYKRNTNQGARSYCIIHGSSDRIIHGLRWNGGVDKEKRAVQHVCEVSEVRSNHNSEWEVGAGDDVEGVPLCKIMIEIPVRYVCCLQVGLRSKLFPLFYSSRCNYTSSWLILGLVLFPWDSCSCKLIISSCSHGCLLHYVLYRSLCMIMTKAPQVQPLFHQVWHLGNNCLLAYKYFVGGWGWLIIWKG